MVGDIRDRWIRFFEARGHLNLSNRPLIPCEGDNSLLFVNSGIAAIKPLFCNPDNSPSRRIVSCQKVIRTSDIDSIGETFRHHTYFEMLGNFSLGDYFKAEAIAWAWEFLTRELGLSGDRLYVTIFNEDDESKGEWSKWISPGRIIPLGRDSNFWDMGVGPCGPCTEIYYDRGSGYDPRGPELIRDNIENNRYLEIWNIVFSEYMNVDGKIIPSERRNIDTGAGLERLLTILEGCGSNFENSLFAPIVSLLGSRASDVPERKLWAAADYLRATVLIIHDGISFGNKGREYVLRRIFRRALCILAGRVDLGALVTTVAMTLRDLYPDMNEEFILGEIMAEHGIWLRTSGQADDLIGALCEANPTTIPAEEIFNLVATHGIDLWLIGEELGRRGRKFDRGEYERLMAEHRKISHNRNISMAFEGKARAPELRVRNDLDYGSHSLRSVIVAVLNVDFDPMDELDGVGYVMLERTNIFPAIAGQEGDIGYIDGVGVQETLRIGNDQVIHKVYGSFSLGQEVVATVDSMRRSGIEAHHSLEHLLYALLRSKLDPKIGRHSGKKFHDHFTLEVTVPRNITSADFDLGKLNGELNDLIAQSIPVTIEWISPARARELGLMGKFSHVYESCESLRLVTMGNSSELCIGTHVTNTSQIGSALITQVSKKQSNVYKFRVLAGDGPIGVHLGERRAVEENLEKKRRARDSSRAEFDSLRGIILERLGGNRFLLLRERWDQGMVLDLFKEIRYSLRGNMILYVNVENLRFAMISDFADIPRIMGYLRDRHGWRGGGNAHFASGVASSLTDELAREIESLV